MPCPVGLDQHLSAWGDRELERLAILAVPQRTLAVTTPSRLEVRSTPKALEASQRVIRHEHDVSTSAAIAAVRTAFGYVRFAAEAEAAIAAAAGLYVDASMILHLE
jgi:hypothetical protein